MSRQVVAFTACARPAYLRKTIASWEAARGIGDAHVIFCVEPVSDEVAGICLEAFSGAASVHLNPVVYGEAENQWRAIEAGFATGTDFVILAEDDDVVSTDVLEYFAWAAAHFRDRPEVFAAAAFRHHRVPGGLAGVALLDFFPCNVWGIWRDRWENHLRDDWRSAYMVNGWDSRITGYWVKTLGYKIAVPCECRAQNFGELGGVHGDGPRGQSDCFAAGVAPQDYYEVAS